MSEEIFSGNQNNKPIVDIILPNYNKGEYLNEAINSVFNQTLKIGNYI